MLSFCSGSESPRVAMEHVPPSVVRTEAAKETLGCRPSGEGFFCELISLTFCFSLSQMG